MSNNELNKKNNTTKTKHSLKSLLIQEGFILPTTAEDVEKYEKYFGTTDIILPEEVDSADFIFKGKDKINNDIISEQEKGNRIPSKIISIDSISFQKKEISTEHKNNDYFKKIVLAAEIAYQLCAEPTFGHKKFVKINYLCEEICNMQLSTNYGQYAAGPLDPKHMYSVDAEFKKKKWFSVTKRANNYGYKYSPAENVDEYKKYYPWYFKDQIDSISRIIELFRKKDSNFCEIIATMFYVWKRAISQKITIDNTLLIKHFYDWGEEKKVFKEPELVKAIHWMQEEQIVPCI